MPVDGSAISRKVREARETANLSRDELAAKIGVTRAAVRNWEEGERHPRYPQLAALAKATGRTVAWFYEEAA